MLNCEDISINILNRFPVKGKGVGTLLRTMPYPTIVIISNLSPNSFVFIFLSQIQCELGGSTAGP